MGNIKVFCINLKKRIDRKKHIIQQFDNMPFFKLTVVNAIEHQIGAVGLWETVRKIVGQAKDNQYEYVIICEDDHCFTEKYDAENLINQINFANGLNADLLLGGVSYFDDAVEISQSLFWLSGFTGFQFVIMFRRFYQNFLNIDFNSYDNIDLKMESSSQNIYCMFPFISTQKEFGYSDVTKKNEQPGVVVEYFRKSEKRLQTLSSLNKHFDKLNNLNEYD